MSAEADRIARAALILLESHDVDGFLRTLPAPTENPLVESGRKGVERVYTLASPLRVTMTPEEITHKLIKLVRKEIQTGDKAFDAKVYITTDTPDVAAAWLDIEALRSAILPIIASGGKVDVSGESVTLVAWSDGDPASVLDDRTVATILAHVEAVAQPIAGD